MDRWMDEIGRNGINGWRESEKEGWRKGWMKGGSEG